MLCLFVILYLCNCVCCLFVMLVIVCDCLGCWCVSVTLQVCKCICLYKCMHVHVMFIFNGLCFGYICIFECMSGSSPAAIMYIVPYVDSVGSAGTARIRNQRRSNASRLWT